MRSRGRLQRVLAVVGLSFAIGALTGAGLLWRLQPAAPGADPWLESVSSEITALGGKGPPSDDPAPAHDPAEPRGVERPGESGSSEPVGTVGSVAHAAAVEVLRGRRLLIPAAGVDRDDLRDTFFDSRGSRAHEAIDIMAPRHTEVRAVDDGRIEKLYSSKAGGVTIYQFEPSGTFCYYYAHLDRYAEGLEEGQRVKRGQVIGYVGSTGNANSPHLHFAIFQLTPERRWWKGEPVNPYPVFR